MTRVVLLDAARRKLQLFASRFRHEKQGVAAIEFAFIAPILLIVFLGSVEFSQALTLDRRDSQIKGSTADLVAQSDSISTPDLNDIALIADDILETALVMNHNPNNFDLVLISVVTDADGKATVDWSYQKGGSEPYAPGSDYNKLPNGLLGPLESVVVSEVSYNFKPEIGHFLTGSIALEENFYLRPRRSMKVTKSD